MIKNQIVKKGKHKEIKAPVKYSSFFMQSKIHLRIMPNTYGFMFSPCTSATALTTLCNKSPLVVLYWVPLFIHSVAPSKLPTLCLSFNSTTPTAAWSRGTSTDTKSIVIIFTWEALKRWKGWKNSLIRKFKELAREKMFLFCTDVAKIMRIAKQ